MRLYILVMGCLDMTIITFTVNTVEFRYIKINLKKYR